MPELRELRRAVQSACDLHGVVVEFERIGGGRQRATLKSRDQRRVVFFASTQSGWQALHNLLGHVRHANRQIDDAHTLRLQTRAIPALEGSAR
jgi:hypothetical protein